jgi:FAD/FMN-containing dehydrogenase
MSLELLQSQFRGELIGPQDAAYDSARRVYNAMIDKHPRLIARCTDVADVMAAVAYGNQAGLLTAIRSGGHNGGGLGVCEGGLVIDLSRMKGIRVDPDARAVRVAPGAVWGEVDHATHAFGLAVPSGFVSTTGVGGLTLGGGIGNLTRPYGLTIDNLLAVDVVLADGSFVQANAEENADLFWAIRGGGGNFGVVTSFVFQAHPVRNVFAGPTLWPTEQASEVMHAFRDFLRQAPPEVSGFFAFLTVPPAPMFPVELHNRKVCGVVWCCTAPPKTAERLIAPMRAVGKPVLDQVGPMPFPVLQSLFDPLYPSGLQWYWRADFMNDLSDDAIAAYARQSTELPTPLSTVHIYPIDGAAHRIASDETAFSYRDANWAEVIVGVDPDPANAETVTEWCKGYFDALHPYSAGGAYVNFMMEEGADRVRASFRDNFDRLGVVKRRYDPNNFFRVNQNIRPADGTGPSLIH